jgi:hypothetical protein
MAFFSWLKNCNIIDWLNTNYKRVFTCIPQLPSDREGVKISPTKHFLAIGIRRILAQPQPLFHCGM